MFSCMPALRQHSRPQGPGVIGGEASSSQSPLCSVSACGENFARSLAPRRRKLRILRPGIVCRGSVASLLRLSPAHPLRWAAPGPLLPAPPGSWFGGRLCRPGAWGRTPHTLSLIHICSAPQLSGSLSLRITVHRTSIPSWIPDSRWTNPLSTWCRVRLPVPFPLTALVSSMNWPHRLMVVLFFATLAWAAEHSAIFSPSTHASPQVPLITRFALSMVRAISSQRSFPLTPRPAGSGR